MEVSKHEAGEWWNLCTVRRKQGFREQGMYTVNKTEVMRQRGDKTGGSFGWDAALGSEENGAGFEHGPEVGWLSEASGVIVASAKHCREDW